MEDKDFFLTTKDNPYDPFTQFDQWLAFDEQMGYYTLPYLARVAQISNEMSDTDQDLALRIAMDEICINDPTQNYVQVDKM